MAAADQFFKIGLDVQGVVASAQAFAASLQANTNAAINFQTRLEEFNSKGAVTKAVLVGMDQAGKQYEVTLKKKGDALRVVNTVVKQNAEALETAKRKEIEATQAAEAAQRRQQAGIVGSSLLKNLGVSPSTLKEASQLELQLNRIRKSIEDGTVSFTRFGQIYQKLQADPRAIIPDVTAAERKVVTALRTIIELKQKQAKAVDDLNTKEQAKADKTQARLQKEADQQKRVADSIVAAGKLLQSGLLKEPTDFRQANFIENQISKIKRSIESGKISLKEFDDLLKKVVANPNAFLPNLTPAQQQIANALRSISGNFQTFQKSAKDAGESLIITFGGVVRLLEALVIKRFAGQLISELQQAFSEAQKYSLKIAEIQTISQTSNLTTRDWAQGIRLLSEEFGRNPVDVAEAAYQTLSNQVAKGAQTFEFLETSLKFSQAAVTDTATSVNLLSAALTSFKLPVTEADRVAGVLFKTIELGRVRANEMSETFGRFGGIASALGISLEEVAASITTLTIRGIKFNEASTLVNNVLLKLLRPTEEMTKLLKEWGFSSGEAAVQTLSFAGILKKLDEEALKGGVNRLGELFNQIRGIRGIVGLTGNAFQEYGKDLEAIKQASLDYAKATDIVRQSLGQQFTKELNKIKVFFLDDFGTKILKIVLETTNRFGGLANSIKFLTNIIISGTAAFVAYKGALIAFNTLGSTILLIDTLSASMKNFTTITSIATAASNAFKAANPALLLAGTAAAIAFGATAFGGSTENFGDLKRELNAQRNEKERSLEVSNRNAIEAERKMEAEKNQILQDSTAVKFQTILQYVAETVKLSNKLTETELENLKLIQEEVKATGEVYKSSIQNALNEVRSEIGRITTNIKSSLKFSIDLPREANQTILSGKLSFASDDQQIELLQKQLKRLTERARALFAEGTEISVQEARRVYQEIEQLQLELFSREQNRRKQQLEEDVRSGKVKGTIGPDGQERVVFTAETVKLEREINKLVQERLALEANYRKDEAIRRAKLQEDEKKEVERLKKTQDTLKQIAEFSVTNKEGKVKEEFQKDPTKASKDFDALIQKLNQTAGPEAIKSQFQFFVDLQRQKAAIAAQVETAIRDEQAETLRQSIINAKKEVEERQKLAISTKAETEKLIKDTSSSLDESLKALDKIFKTNFESFRPFGGEGRPVNQKTRNALEEVLKTFQELQKIRGSLATEKDVSKIAELNAQMERLFITVSNYVKLRTDAGSLFGGGGKSISQVGLPGEEVSIAQTLKAFRAEFDLLGKTVQAQAEATNQLAQSKQALNDLNDVVRQIPENVAISAKITAELNPQIKRSFRDITDEVSKLVDKIIRMNTELLKLGAANPGVVPNNPGPIPGRADGGFAPRGKDTHLGLFDPNEFIVNGMHTNKFYPQLVAMNVGIRPNSYSDGGKVINNNFGDIKISMSGTNPSIREFGQKLKRAFKRGNISLD